LLPTGRKKRESAGPAGDSDSQVRARRAFFDGGHYDPILTAAADAVCAVLASQGAGRGGGAESASFSHPLVVLDAGCGEGAYLGALAAHPALPPATALVGIDVSKPAIRLGAARHGGGPGGARFAVASSFAIPLEAGAVACALVAMAPPPPRGELARILAPGRGGGGGGGGVGGGGGGGDHAGGGLVVIRPGPAHLDGLRRAVYGKRAVFAGEGDGGGGGEGEAGCAAGAPGTLTRTARTRLTFPLSLAGPAAGQLLGMTPYAWSAPRGLADRLQADGLETAADVWGETFRRA
jgi:23S rRNA (guanine745-N1)-methyltransferase